MAIVNLGYGKDLVDFEFREDRFDILGHLTDDQPLTDRAIGDRFDRPIGAPALEDLVGSGQSVLLVVPDATRRTASGQIVNLLVRRLIAAGIMPFDIRIIFATGIHRKVTDKEKIDLVTPFIAQRIKLLDHNARDLAGIIRIGETADGIPIELNRALTEHDHVIIIGGINFHYFAGFTGGRKLICPGLASPKTINDTHRLAFDDEKRCRRSGVGPGRMDGNPVHEAFMEIVDNQPPSWSVNTIVNEQGLAIEVFAGDWRSAHLTACEHFAARHTVQIPEKRDLVIVSCGGFPHDINMIQAHKALDAAARACTDGGTIILLAECAEGLGRKDFLKWFEAGDSDELAGNLSDHYQVNGQTAWALLCKAERFDIRIITLLESAEIEKMRLRKAVSLEAALSSGIDPTQKGYILPYGAKFQMM